MEQRLRYITSHIITLSIIFVIGLGSSLAGNLPCLPGCPDCGPVPSCCKETSGASEVGSNQTPGPATKKSGCEHEGLCLDGAQPSEPVFSGVIAQYDLSLVLLPSSPEPSLEPFGRLDPLLGLKSVQQKSPPLYLKNCSFLI